MAGCILVDNEKIQVINRSPKYKNKYVHRRTSLSLQNLSASEVLHVLNAFPSLLILICITFVICLCCVQIEERRRLGLVRFSIAMEDMSRLLNIRNSHGGDEDDGTALADFDGEDEDGNPKSATLRPGF